MRSLLVALSFGGSTLFAEGGAGGFDMMQFVPIVLIFVIFYFLIMRPQQKKAQAHHEMLKELRRGDKVVTAGGILGVVDKIVNDKEVSIEIAENVKIRVVKATVTEVLAKTQPIAETSKPIDDKKTPVNQDKPEVAITSAATEKKVASAGKSKATAKAPAKKAVTKKTN